MSLLLTMLSFAIILVMGRLRVPLGAAIIAGALSLGLFFQLPPAVVGLTALEALIKPMSIGLLVTITLLLAISESMRQTGQTERIILLTQAFLRRPALTMAALPALIGLLPMPGGAVFSAPMVEAAAASRNVSPALLSAINYWWRHIWEHWWPLYPGVILAMSLTHSSLGVFAAYQLPLGVAMAVAGLMMLRHVDGGLRASHDAPPVGTKRKLVRATAAIWVILVVWMLAAAGLWLSGGACGDLTAMLGISGQASQAMRQFLPLDLGLLGSLIYTMVSHKLPPRQGPGLIFNKHMVPLLALVAAVMMYQTMLERTDAATLIGQNLNQWHVPAIVVVILLPLIAGLLTGVAFGFVGVSFPIILLLVSQMPGEPAMRPYAVLAYGVGHLGMMISPIHLCYVVSNRYFKTDFWPVYRHILWPCAIMAACLGGYFLLLKSVM